MRVNTNPARPAASLSQPPARPTALQNCPRFHDIEYPRSLVYNLTLISLFEFIPKKIKNLDPKASRGVINRV